jgi:hypothetical protein
MTDRTMLTATSRQQWVAVSARRGDAAHRFQDVVVLNIELVTQAMQ